MVLLTDYLQVQSRLIEERLEALFPSRHQHYASLFESARYAILGGGKRLRPILALTTVSALKGDVNQALTPACTLEMIHAYSLIHDDLPCMDDDDYRRGKPTVHKQFSEGQAVLTGDFLLTFAFEVLASDPLLPAEKKIRLIETLARQSGSDGMIGGQVMDITCGGKTITLETLRLLHHNKTGALMIAAVEFGGIIANATPFEMSQLRQFGEYMGLAFQVTDDILDVTSSQAKHGRAIASDVLNEKSTYVSLLGLEQAKAYASNYHKQAIQSLKCLPGDTSLLIELADFAIQRKS